MTMDTTNTLPIPISLEMMTFELLFLYLVTLKVCFQKITLFIILSFHLRQHFPMPTILNDDIISIHYKTSVN